MNDRSRLYYEGHITLAPVSGDQLVLLHSISSQYNMRVSTFLMVKPGEEPDAFTSLRDPSYASIVVRMHEAIKHLEQYPFFIIKRVKIEDTILDTKQGDDKP